MNLPYCDAETNQLPNGFPMNRIISGFRVDPLWRHPAVLSSPWGPFRGGYGPHRLGRVARRVQDQYRPQRHSSFNLTEQFDTAPAARALGIGEKGQGPAAASGETHPHPEAAAPYVVATRQPSLVGGFIDENDYPTEMRKQKKEGRVIVELLINIEGEGGQGDHPPGRRPRL